MTDGPLISCVVPVFNRERYIGSAIESILAQTYRPLEVIVVDDGSTDRTPEIVRAFGAPVQYVVQPARGPASARNYGVEIARGALIAELDSDDLWHPEKLARQMALMLERPDVDICLTHLQNIWDDELAEEAERLKDNPRAQPLPGFIFSTLLASKSVFERVGPCDVERRHTHVTTWFLRAQTLGLKIEVLPDVLMWHRNHDAMMTRREDGLARDEFLDLVRAHLGQKRHEPPDA